MKSIDLMTKDDKRTRNLFYVPGKGWVTGRFREEFKLEDGTKVNSCFIDDYAFIIQPLFFASLPENPI